MISLRPSAVLTFRDLQVRVWENDFKNVAPMRSYKYNKTKLTLCSEIDEAEGRRQQERATR